MADEVVTRYKLDASEWMQGANAIESGSEELVKDNAKLQTSFAETGKKSAQAFATDKVKQFNTEAGKALKGAKKDSDELAKSTGAVGNGFLAMRKQLKETQGQLAILAANGRENSKLFKALSADAGKLRDQMADLGDSIKFQAASPLENLTGSISGAKSALLNLDIEGAARAFNIAGNQISRISFKELSSGIGDTVKSIGKLGAAILTSPLFLIGGAIAGIVYAITQWESELDVLAKKNERAAKAIQENLDAVTNSYDNQIAEAKALGKETDKLEIERANRVISANEKISKNNTEFLVKRQAQLRKEAEAQVLITGKTVSEQLDLLKEGDEQYQKIREQTVQADREVENARSSINQITNAKIKESNDKANEDYKKYLADRQKALEDAVKKAEEFFKRESDTQRFYEQEEAARITKEGQEKIDKILEGAFPQRAKKIRTLQDDINDVILENNAKILDDEKNSYQERQNALDELLRNNLISEEAALEAQKSITDQKIAERKREIDAVFSFARDFAQIGIELNKLAMEAGAENAEVQKAFAAFAIGIDLAQSLANVIVGATQAAAAGGPAAPFLLAGYITSGVAAVLAAFSQVNNLFATSQPPQLHTGGYTGDGGKYQAAGIVHKGEWVMNQETSAKYYDALEAMHTGTYDDYLFYRHIEPALSNAIHEYKASADRGLAENIASSMRLNFKDGNLLKALAHGNEGADRNTNKIVKAINKKNRTAYRKK